MAMKMRRILVILSLLLLSSCTVVTETPQPTLATDELTILSHHAYKACRGFMVGQAGVVPEASFPELVQGNDDVLIAVLTNWDDDEDAFLVAGRYREDDVMMRFQCVMVYEGEDVWGLERLEMWEEGTERSNGL